MKPISQAPAISLPPSPVTSRQRQLAEANRVEVPCLGKNVMAASNALACANMALAGFDPIIPLDEVIASAKHVASQMPREVRCTNLGGLSITPTAIALEAKLAARRASSCGSGCGCG